MLIGEVESRPAPEPGSVPLPQLAREDTLAIPKCTIEDIRYLVECWNCRLIGKKYTYVGKSSRSRYQRAREHQQEITLG